MKIELFRDREKGFRVWSITLKIREKSITLGLMIEEEKEK